MQIDSFDLWWRFAVALLIGALIGLEREYVQQRREGQEFGGIRTFTLLALVGGVGAHLTDQFGPLAFAVPYAGVILALAVSNLGPALKGREEGITTEVAALLMPLLGGLIVRGQVELGAALGVLTALALALKPILHGMARAMERVDLRATLEFAIITAVILPLVPNQGFGPNGVLNPFQIWLMVVLVSGLSFLGYVLMKIVGAEQGLGLTALLGGIVSSTATTMSFAGRSKANVNLSNILALGILLSSSVMFPRMLIEVGIVNPNLLPMVAPPIVAMFVVGMVIVFYFWRRQEEQGSGSPSEIDLGNPLRLRTAISFAVIFAIVLLLVKFASDYFGSAGVIVASVIAGITDVDSITLSVANLAAQGDLENHLAAVAIVLAGLTNTTTKVVMAGILGSVELRRRLLLPFGIVLATGLVSGALLLL